MCLCQHACNENDERVDDIHELFELTDNRILIFFKNWKFRKHKYEGRCGLRYEEVNGIFASRVHI